MSVNAQRVDMLNDDLTLLLDGSTYELPPSGDSETKYKGENNCLLSSTYEYGYFMSDTPPNGIDAFFENRVSLWRFINEGIRTITNTKDIEIIEGYILTSVRECPFPYSKETSTEFVEIGRFSADIFEFIATDNIEMDYQEIIPNEADRFITSSPIPLVMGANNVTPEMLYKLHPDFPYGIINTEGNIPDNTIGQSSFNVTATFDNGTRSLIYDFMNHRFEKVEGIKENICSGSERVIDLRDYFMLSPSFTGNPTPTIEANVPNENFIWDISQLSDGNHAVIVSATAFNGTKNIQLDFYKTNIEVGAGEKQNFCQDGTLELISTGPNDGIWSVEQMEVIDGIVYPGNTPPGTYIATYTVMENNCTFSDEKIIELYPRPQVSAGEDISVCKSDVTYDLGSGNPLGGEWVSNDTELIITDGIVNLQLLNIPEVGFADYSINYSYTNENGCTSVAKKKLRVYAEPEIPELKKQDICGEGQTNIEIVNFNPAFVYEWYKDDQKIIGINGKSHTTDVISSPTNYKVIARNPFLNTCSNVGEIDVNVVLPPIKPVTQGDIRCGSGMAKLSAGGVPGATYRWYNTNDVPLFEGDIFETEIAQTTLFYVSAILNGCEGEKAEVTATSLFQPAPPLVSGVSRCGQGTVSVTASGASSGGEYLWYSSMDAQSPILSGVATYVENELTESKKIFVSVRMKDTGCESERTSVDLQILPIPAVPEIKDVYFCEGAGGASLEIESPVSSYSYEWYSQYNTVPTGLLATGTLFFTGQLMVSTSYYVQAISAEGCRSGAKEVKAIFVQEGELNIGTDTVMCIYGEAIDLDNGLPDLFKGKGIFTGPGVFGRTFSPSTLGVGSHTVSYQASLGGCPIAGKRTVQVKSGLGRPTLPISENSFSICPERLPFDLRSFVPGYNNGVFTGEGVNGNNFTALQGSYELLYTLDTAGCYYESPFNITVLENNAQAPNILSDKEEYCTGNNAILEAKGNGGEQFHWYSDNNLTDKLHSGKVYNTIVEQPTLFVVSEDVNGCISTATNYTIPVLSLPTKINHFSDSIEVGGFVQFSVNPINPSIVPKLTLSWDFGNGEISKQLAPAVFYHSAGHFNVSVEIKNGNCTDTLYTDVLVESDSIVDLVTSVQKIEETRPLVYPQLVNDRLYVQILNGTWRCNIYDIHGRKVYQDLIRSSCEIPTSKWMEGLYLLMLKNEENIFNFKLLKQ